MLIEFMSKLRKHPKRTNLYSIREYEVPKVREITR